MNQHDYPWREVEVWAYDRATVFAFTGERKLAVLRLWRSGERLPLVWFTRAASDVLDRAAVDWTGFPEPGAAPT
jgi:hypothetical protein